MKHTKGEWNYKIQGFKITIGNDDSGATKNGHDYTVCEINDNSFQAEANAQLIVAAPELLERLTNLTATMLLLQNQLTDLGKQKVNEALSLVKRLSEKK